jgi:hypothetical protein
MIADLTSQLEAERHQLREAQRDAAISRQALETSTQSLSQARRQAADYLTQLEATNIDLCTAKTSCAGLQAAVAALNNDKGEETSLRTHLAVKEGELAAEKGAATRLRQTLATRERQLAAAKDEVISLQQTLDARARELDNAQAEAADLRTNLDARGRELDSAHAEAASLRTIVAEREREWSARKAETDELQTQIARAREVAGRFDTEISLLAKLCAASGDVLAGTFDLAGAESPIAARAGAPPPEDVGLTLSGLLACCAEERERLGRVLADLTARLNQTKSDFAQFVEAAYADEDAFFKDVRRLVGRGVKDPKADIDASGSDARLVESFQTYTADLRSILADPRARDPDFGGLNAAFESQRDLWKRCNELFESRQRKFSDLVSERGKVFEKLNGLIDRQFQARGQLATRLAAAIPALAVAGSPNPHQKLALRAVAVHPVVVSVPAGTLDFSSATRFAGEVREFVRHALHVAAIPSRVVQQYSVMLGSQFELRAVQAAIQAALALPKDHSVTPGSPAETLQLQFEPKPGFLAAQVLRQVASMDAIRMTLCKEVPLLAQKLSNVETALVQQVVRQDRILSEWSASASKLQTKLDANPSQTAIAAVIQDYINGLQGLLTETLPDDGPGVPDLERAIPAAFGGEVTAWSACKGVIAAFTDGLGKFEDQRRITREAFAMLLNGHSAFRAALFVLVANRIKWLPVLTVVDPPVPEYEAVTIPLISVTEPSLNADFSGANEIVSRVRCLVGLARHFASFPVRFADVKPFWTLLSVRFPVDDVKRALQAVLRYDIPSEVRDSGFYATSLQEPFSRGQQRLLEAAISHIDGIEGTTGQLEELRRTVEALVVSFVEAACAAENDFVADLEQGGLGSVFEQSLSGDRLVETFRAGIARVRSLLADRRT